MRLLTLSRESCSRRAPAQMPTSARFPVSFIFLTPSLPPSVVLWSYTNGAGRHGADSQGANGLGPGDWVQVQVPAGLPKRGHVRWRYRDPVRDKRHVDRPAGATQEALRKQLPPTT
jgi:hypothetical protein